MNPAATGPPQDSQPSQQEQETVLKVFDGDFLINEDDSKREQPADNTCRPDKEPVEARGYEFKPFQPTYREAIIRALPLSPLLLFQLFIPESLVEKWVKYTNKAAATLDPPSPSDNRHPENTQKDIWKPVTVDEIYLWLGVIIYLGIHPEKAIKSHWVVPKEGEQRPTHPIIKFITFERFQQIKRRLQIYPHTSTDSFTRCDEWSNHIQDKSLEVYNPGTSIAIDEAMDRFTGRSKQTSYVPNKPTPRGFKMWVVAQRGYFLRWIWHDPKAPLGPVGRRRKRKRDLKLEDDTIYLNPTQSVVVALVNLLPRQTYHVYLDNLFSSPNLFEALLELGSAATGTCRINCGIYKPFVVAKGLDKQGKCWAWGTLKAVPTVNGKASGL